MNLIIVIFVMFSRSDLATCTQLFYISLSETDSVHSSELKGKSSTTSYLYRLRQLNQR